MEMRVFAIDGTVVKCAVAAALLASCSPSTSGPQPPPPSPQPTGTAPPPPPPPPPAPKLKSWALPGYEEVPLFLAPDLDPDPKRFETPLEARPAKVALQAGKPEVEMWTYEGIVPGPLIRVKQGDTIRVRFRNKLPEETMVHWHGLRVPNAMDGSHATQSPVLPNQEFIYEYPTLDSAAFWYHTHTMSHKQVGFGLYGPLVVDGLQDPPELGEPAILVLSDASVGADGKLEPVDDGDIEAGMVGRLGNVLLVNGREKPTVSLEVGRRVRWQLINAARSRFFRVHVAGHWLTRIGGDGGLLEKPIPDLEEVLLGPGERADVVFTPTGAVGDTIVTQMLYYHHGNTEGDTLPLMNLKLVAPRDPKAPPSPPLPKKLREIDRLSVPRDLAEDVIGIGANEEGFLVNKKPQNGGQPLPAKVGETRLYSLTNHSMYSHPFHLHGFFFQLLNPDTLEAAEPVEWRDTYNLPPFSSTLFAVRYDDRPGPWMFHCHILDHMELGLSLVVHLKR